MKLCHQIAHSVLTTLLVVFALCSSYLLSSPRAAAGTGSPYAGLCGARVP